MFTVKAFSQSDSRICKLCNISRLGIIQTAELNSAPPLWTRLERQILAQSTGGSRIWKSGCEKDLLSRLDDKFRRDGSKTWQMVSDFLSALTLLVPGRCMWSLVLNLLAYLLLDSAIALTGKLSQSLVVTLSSCEVWRLSLHSSPWAALKLL